MLRTGEEPILGYRLDKFLGRGQFGDVWQAQAPGGKLVALKFINIIGKQGLKEYRAIQKVKNIQHPHLMPIIAFWILDQEQNVLSDEVLEQLDQAAQGQQVDVRKTQMGEEPIPNTLVVAMLLGEASLYDYFEKCQEEGKPGIPIEELLDYMEEAAKGIDFLNRPTHDLGEGPVAIQHCDIKPHNMLLTGGSVQICDFGLARVLEDVRQTRSVAGTPAYIAPESISGRRPSASTDQYSLAITYYEMRTGDLPFADDDRTSQMAIMQAHMKGRLDFVLSPPAEAAVLRKATSVEPENRYITSLAMVRALRKAHEQPQQQVEQPSGAPDLSGTMDVDNFQSSPLANSGDSSGEFTNTELTDTPQEASATLNAAGIDGTMVVPADGQSTAGQSTAGQSPTAPSNAAPVAERPTQQQSKSNVPLAVAALLLMALLGGGGFFWWQANQPTPVVDNGGNGSRGGNGNNGSHDGGGGSGTQTETQQLQFEPADAQVKLNGQSIDLQNGTYELDRPESSQIYVEASHDSGEWELAKTYSWSELEALGFQIKLNRTAQSFVNEAWTELANGKLDQAITLYANALRLNRALVDMPPPHWLLQHDSYVNAIALSSDDRWLGSVSDGKQHNAFAWNLSPKPPYGEPTPLPGQEDLLEAVEISPDGRWLATGGAGGKVQLWQVGQFEKGAIELTGLDQDVLALAFNSTSQYLAASSYGTAVVVWHLDRVPQQTTPQYTLDAHEEAVPALAFVPGSTRLLTGGWDDNVKQWRLPAPDMPSEGKLEPVDLEGPLKSDINVVAIDPGGNWLAVGTTERVVLWDLTKNEDGVELISRGYSIEALAFSPDGKHLAVADANGQVYSCAMEPHKFPEEIRQHKAHKGAVMALAFSPNGRLLASGGSDKRIMLWDMQALRALPTELIGHADNIRDLEFQHHSRWLISAADDGKIGLWEYGRWVVIDRALSSPNVGPTIEARRREVRLPTKK